ncbi:phage portal protein [Bacillus pseudomycoides]|uniref:phage portal protein n=1 Tax=Bacillus pseudomycoides TaxID=64104 RepID=UPI000BFE5DDB|nr:phage portal protein [Bacillus pseudomycoides]PHB23108.1 phage portal protein [Bacillus pseudomycoides]PHE37637.1 phage portal protein [Bacillus pseudomycoides]
MGNSNLETNQHIVTPILQPRRKHYLKDATDYEKIIEVVRTNSISKGDYALLRRYYEGYHNINFRGFDDETKPNNRVSHNFPKIIVDTATSYFTGIPVTYESKNTKLLEEVQKINKTNHADDVNSELDKLTNMFGHAFEIHWIEERNEKAIHRFKYISPENGVIFYSPNMLEIPVAFCLWIEREDATTKEKFYDIQLYDNKNVCKLTIDSSGEVVGIDEPTPHMFDSLPVVEFINNEERKSSFEMVITLIDSYNKVVSDTINDVEYWADSYLLLKDMSGTESEDIAAMKQQRVMLVEGTGDASFLEKPANDKHLENIKDRLTQDIHKFAQVPNLHDEQFAANLSGVAIKWKMKDLEDKTSQKERKFTKSLAQRHELMQQILAKKQILSASPDNETLEPTFVRNLPANLVELAELASKVPPDLFSKQTLRAQFPFKFDEKEEAARIKKEQEASVEKEMGANPFLQKPPQGSNEPPKASDPSEPPKDDGK